MSVEHKHAQLDVGELNHTKSSWCVFFEMLALMR